VFVRIAILELLARRRSAERDTELVALFTTLGQLDSDLALRMIDEIGDAPVRQAVALALFDVLRMDPNAIDRVASALPVLETVNFRIAAIERLAISDMTSAISVTASLPIHQQRLALLHLVPIAVANDPLGSAATAAQRISLPTLRSEFLNALLVAVAEVDPSKAFEYLEDLEEPDFSDFVRADAMYVALASVDPGRLLQLADQVPSMLRGRVQGAALEELVRREPTAAVSYINSLQSASLRHSLSTRIARVFGEENPNDALAWSSSQFFQSDDLFLSVLDGVQSVDVALASDVIISQLEDPAAKYHATVQAQLPRLLAGFVASIGSSDLGILLERFSGLSGPAIRPALREALEKWASTDAQAALAWSVSHADMLEAGVFERVAEALARENISLTQQKLFEVPEDLRGEWASGILRTLISQDIDASKAWVYSLPEDYIRDAALKTLVRTEAINGAFDAALLNDISDAERRREASQSVALILACNGHVSLSEEVVKEYFVDPSVERDFRVRVDRLCV
jgi:hypothetical protein